jgi:ankyrin repeat protein
MYYAETTANAHNRFRWVDCQLLSLASCPSSQFHLDKALKSLPRTLDETYERMLMNIDPDFIDDAKRILTWLCFSERLVRVYEVIEGLAVELGEQPRLNCERRLQDPHDIFRICPGLISIVNTINDLSDSDHASQLSDPSFPKLSLRIAHFSVQEYLESDRIRSQSAANFALESRTAHTELAKTCLVYLQNVRLHELNRFLLASYAAKHWYIHLKKGDENCDSLNLLATHFLGSKDDIFENWIRIDDPDHKYGIEKQVELKRSSEEIASPFYYACLLGLYRPLQLLLKADSVKRRIDALGGNSGTALQAASQKGFQHIVQLLLNHGAEVNAQGGLYDNALQAASTKGHEQIVKLLIAHDAKVNAQGGRYDTALHAASYQGHEQIVKLLIAHNAKVNTQGRRYGTALHAASHQGYEQIVKLLIAHNADVNAQGGRYMTALKAASLRVGNKQIVELLIAHGAEVNTQGGLYSTALQAASYAGDEQIVKLLIASSAEVQGALHMAMASRRSYEQSAASNVQIVKLLIAHSVSTNVQDALQVASNEGLEQIVKLLIDHATEVNAKKGHLISDALLAASDLCHSPLVKSLLDRGAIINYAGKDEEGWEKVFKEWERVFMKRTWPGDTEVIRVLLKRGTSFTKQNTKILIQDALFSASQSGQKEAVQLFLGRYRDTDDDTMQIAVKGATEGGHEHLLQLLLDWGVKIDVSAISVASKNGHEKAVRLLLDSGAEIDDDAISAASRNGHERVVRLLLDRRAKIGDDAVLAASRDGHERVVQLLLGRGADIDDTMIEAAIEAAAEGGYQTIVNNNFKNAFYTSREKMDREVTSRYKRVVQLLLDKSQGVDTNRVIQAISAHGHEEMMQWLSGRILNPDSDYTLPKMQAMISAALRWRDEKIMPLLQRSEAQPEYEQPNPRKRKCSTE